MITEQLLTRADVLRAVGWTQKTLKKYWMRGDFPAPIKWGDKQLKWRRSDVEKWMRGERDEKSAA